MKKFSPFDFVNSINYTKEDLLDCDDRDREKDYVPFIVNRQLSYFSDTVAMANEMNINHHIDEKLQYDFLRSLVRKRKRYSKWDKNNTTEKIEAIKEFYGYSYDKAESVSDLINNEQLKEIQSILSKGGIRKS